VTHMAVATDCVSGAAHHWSEYRYSESHVQAVRHCARCGLLSNRVGDPLGHVQPDVQPQARASEVVGAPATAAPFDDTLFLEAGAGDLTSAAQRRRDQLRASTSRDAATDTLLDFATLHVLSGQISTAAELLEVVRPFVCDDVDRIARLQSLALWVAQQRYGVFHDGHGANAVEISARWSGMTELQPMDAEWQRMMSMVRSPDVRRECQLIYSFLAQQPTLRYIASGQRDATNIAERDQQLAFLSQPSHEIAASAMERAEPSVIAYAYWTEAQLHRAARNMDTAVSLLRQAEAVYRSAGDLAGQAFCVMTEADWACAPCSSPLSWNFEVSDCSGPSSSLSPKLQSDEFREGDLVSYDAAEDLYSRAGAPRGLAAIALRRGYQSMLAENWDGAAAHALRALESFRTTGDLRNALLAATHLLMCRLAGAESPAVDAIELARVIGTWGRNAGCFSHTIGLGILVNRFSQHCLLRCGHYEGALTSSRAAETLFTALGASINAAQCKVDQGLIHSAVGERPLASTFLERALDDYELLAAMYPKVSDTLRERVILLATDVYHLALQRSDSDAMERAAARLQMQVDALPAVSTDPADALAKLLEAMASVSSGGRGGATTPSATLGPMRQMASSVIAQCGVLAPLYRAKMERRAGRHTSVDALLNKAEAGLLAIPAAERALMAAVVRAERKDDAGAAQLMREHVAAGGANAGMGGELLKVMQAFGGAFAAKETHLQQRRTHEQAFAAFVRVRAWDDAKMHLTALEALDGQDWWKDDAKPWQPLCDIGELYDARYDTVRALAAYDQAIEQLEQRRAALSRDELKVAIASDKGAQYLYFLAARAAVRSGDAAQGFAYAEAGKSRALLDLMAAGRIDDIDDEDDTVRTWRETGMQLLLQRGLLAQARARRERDAATIAMLEAQVGSTESQLAIAERAVRASHPKLLQAMTASATPMDAAAVSAALAPHSLLLEYFFLGDDLLIWAVSPDGTVQAHHATLDAAALSRDIVALNRACEAVQSWHVQAAALADTLLAPVADAVRASGHITIVPHGAAHLLPFHALPFDGAPLGAARTVSYLPSASVLQWQSNDESAAVIGDEILVVGNPTLDLPSARTEAEFVARQFTNATLLLEGAATEAAVRAHLPTAPLVHLATHGTLDAVEPRRSSLALADDAELCVYELMLMRMQARLVVLSACSTAQGETTGGDDILGLTRGLLAAGAKQAIVSLWPVDDDATALFMEAFYRELRAGASPATSLQRAQHSVRSLTDAEIAERTRGGHRRDGAGQGAADVATERGYEHPYFWAPFVLVG
jgi:CHAT domain-containing protein/tetratricopeptide (TPR) repeat protein